MSTRFRRSRLFLQFAIAVALMLGILVESGATASAREMRTFDEVVLTTVPVIRGFWEEKFEETEFRYESPNIALYNTNTNPGEGNSACGELPVDNAYYCAFDETVYLDYEFMDLIVNYWGDYAAAMILAHEWGHHVHFTIGVYPTIDGELDEEGEVFAIQTELMADCFAGSVLARFEELGMVDEDDIDEVYELVVDIGDLPGTDPTAEDAHGDGQQRRRAFRSGFRDADPTQCGDAVIAILD